MRHLRPALWILTAMLHVTALATFVHGAAYRPNGCDLSLKWTNSTNYLAFCDLCGSAPRTCSQSERDQKAMTLVARATDVDTLLADLYPTEHRKAWTASFLQGLYPRLLWPYEARTLEKSGGGLWIVAADDNTYSIARNVLKFYRAALLGNASKRALAVARLASATDLRAILDVNATLTGPAEFMFGPIPAKIDTARANLAPLDSRPAADATQRALTNRAADLAALALTHTAHGASLPGGSTSTLSAQLAHVQYESLCGADQACLGYRQMPPFHGGCDFGWTDAECLAWKRLEHVFHGRWADAQARGDAAASREAGRDHESAHLCANIGTNPAVLVLFSCTEEPQDVPQCPGPEGVRGKNTCRAFLPFLMAKYGVTP